MLHNFWQEFGKNILVLAPMEDVTDTVFREVVLSISGSDALHVVFTEFTSTDGLCDSRGREKTIERLFVNPSEKQLLVSRGTKLVAQIWGSEPEKFYKSARLILGLGLFDGIDINMGCPVKKVVKKKCCSALIKYPSLAKEIILATKEAVTLPVSVKTRIGYNNVETDNWIGHVLETKPDAIIVHGRTQKMMSGGKAMWDQIENAAKLRDSVGSSTKIIGNGDLQSYTDALWRIEKYGVDGAMVGSGIFKNPWLFNKGDTVIKLDDRVKLARKHISLYGQTWGKDKNYNILKRFFKIYINGFADAAQWRSLLMNTSNTAEALAILDNLEKVVSL